MGRTYSDVCSVKRGGKSVGRRVWTGAFECDDGGLAFRGLRGCGGGEVDGGEEYGGCGGEELHFRGIEGRVDDWVRCSGTWAWDTRREMLGGCEEEWRKGMRHSVYIALGYAYICLVSLESRCID